MKREEKYGLVRGPDWIEGSIPLFEFKIAKTKLTPENLRKIKDSFVISWGAASVVTQIYLSDQ